MLNWISSSGLAALGLGGYFVAGVFVLVGYLNGQTKARRSESDKLADDLIKRLQETVEQQAKDLATMRSDMERHTLTRNVEVQTLRDELKHLQGRNSVLEDLFKGRDPGMQNFLKDAPRLVEVANENNKLAKENANAIATLTQSIVRFVNTLERMESGGKLPPLGAAVGI